MVSHQAHLKEIRDQMSQPLTFGLNALAVLTDLVGLSAFACR
jgi:hypothetical protein